MKVSRVHFWVISLALSSVALCRDWTFKTKQQNNSTFLFNNQQLSSQESHRQRIPLSMSTSPTQRMPRARRRDVSLRLTLERWSLLDRTLARLHALATAGENNHKTQNLSGTALEPILAVFRTEKDWQIYLHTNSMTRETTDTSLQWLIS